MTTTFELRKYEQDAAEEALSPMGTEEIEPEAAAIQSETGSEDEIPAGEEPFRNEESN